MFVNPDYDDYSLQADSPCIGSGRNGGDRGAIPYHTGIDDGAGRPTAFSLYGNYPNPFNGSTTIRYWLAEPADIGLEIFDLAGRKIEAFSISHGNAGEYSFTWNAGNAPSGVYFYKIAGNGSSETRKMTLLK